jgi:hypothetical protein
MIVNRIIAIFFSAFLFGSCGIDNGPSVTVKKFYDDICRGDIAAAKSNLSSTVKLHQSVIDLTLQGRNTACTRAGGISGFDLREEAIDDNSSGVIGDVNFKDGSKEAVRMKLYRESGAWKLAWEIR